MKVLGLCEVLGQDGGANHVARAIADQAPICLIWKQHLGDTCHDQWIDDAQQESEHDGHENGGAQMLGETFAGDSDGAGVHANLSNETMTSMILMPMNGRRIPPTP